MAIRKQKPKKVKSIKLPISKHIDVNFRDYALYVLNNRGIPAFGDGLTNVQKYIIQNSPKQIGKTVSVIGSAISSGYAHGDSSLGGAINKLAKPFGCANKILDGDGFFGTPVKTDAAAPRYTGVKLDSTVASLIKESSFLNTKDEDGSWDPLWLDVPIGLCTTIIGIAVGYKTTVLPRSIEDMQKYFAGEINEVVPSFIGFKGTVKRFESLNRSWVIAGKTKVDHKAKTIQVTSLPPMMKYVSFLNKIENLTERFPKISILNNSRDDINITFTYRGRVDNEFKELVKYIKKYSTMLVTETPVFVKDGTVLVYDKVEDYLDDYKYRRSELEVRRSQYFLDVASDELDYQKAKKEYLEFMLSKKRKDEEVKKFFEKFTNKISQRLDTIRLRLLTSEELSRTVSEINRLEKEKKTLLRQTKALLTKFNKLIDPTVKRGTESMKRGSVDLFDDSDLSEFDGIEIYGSNEETVEDDLDAIGEN